MPRSWTKTAQSKCCGPPSDHPALLDIPATDYAPVAEFDRVTAHETTLEALGLSQRSAGTEGMSEAGLTALVTRDSMIGFDRRSPKLISFPPAVTNRIGHHGRNLVVP